MIAFDTEEVSHDNGLEDRGFSPWIQQNTNRCQLTMTQQKGKVCNQFLGAIKRSSIEKPYNSQEFKKQLNDSQLKSLEEDFRRRAEIKFKEVIRKSIKNRQSLSFRVNRNQGINHINLNLACQYPNTSATATASTYRTLEPKPISVKEQFYIRRTKNGPHRSQQSRQSGTSQSNRYNNILKTQQFFCKTLEINFPTSRTSSDFGVLKRSRRQASYSIRPSSRLNSSRSNRSSNEQKQKVECNVAGAGINLQSNQAVRSRREKYRDYIFHENSQTADKVFLK